MLMLVPRDGLALVQQSCSVLHLIFIQAVDRREERIILLQTLEHILAGLLEMVARPINVESSCGDDGLAAEIRHLWLT